MADIKLLYVYMIVLPTCVMTQDFPSIANPELELSFSVYLMEPPTTAVPQPTTSTVTVTTGPPNTGSPTTGTTGSPTTGTTGSPPTVTTPSTGSTPSTTTSNPGSPPTGSTMNTSPSSTTSGPIPSSSTSVSPGTVSTATPGTSTTGSTITVPTTSMSTITYTTMDAESTSEMIAYTDLTTDTEATASTFTDKNDTLDDEAASTVFIEMDSSSSTEPTTMSTEPTSTATSSTTTSTPVPTALRLKRDVDSVNVRAVTGGYDNGVLEEVRDWLIPYYDSTVGYQSLNITSSEGNSGQIVYMVLYDINVLSANKSLSEEGLIASLSTIRDNIADDNESFDGGNYVLDSAETEAKMTQEIELVRDEQLPAICESQAVACGDAINTCDLSQGQILCREKCAIYNETTNPKCTNPNSDHAIIFLKGKCDLDEHADPYCDCGSSPGDVVRNFYVGSRCVSSAFVIGMSAGVGGALIIAFLAATIGLAVRKKKVERKNEIYDAYRDSARSSNKQELLLDDLNKNRGTNSSPRAYDNVGYAGYQETKDNASEIRVESEFPNFQANLSHIDPEADYTIKRPSFRTNDKAQGNGSVQSYESESVDL